MVVEVRAINLRPLEAPEAYADIPRRIFGNDRKVQPWGSQAPRQP
jgi:hypothetical protein